ncbi:MAG TPA: hypothetical protein DCE18_07445, partial [Syntrophobacteraceae bacterium]|nr:hypothetical protein [Syntrophobacteraceae bacterium]
LARYLRGWVSYVGISDYYRPIPEVDHWLRRRLRMCYWKRWRRARTKVRELLKLGTSLSASISVAMSRKGPWRLARSLLANTTYASSGKRMRSLLQNYFCSSVCIY